MYSSNVSIGAGDTSNVTISRNSSDVSISANASTAEIGNTPIPDPSAHDLLSSATLWLDASYSVASEQSVVNYGSGGSVLNARYGSTTGVDSNDPKLLTFTGENGFYQPSSAVSTNFIATPSTADVQITGDIAIAVKITPDEVFIDKTMVIKRQNGVDGNLIPFNFKMTNSGTGRLGFGYCNAAGTTTTYYPTVNHGRPIGTTVWFGVQFDVNNGSGQNVLRFYWSEDGISWTLIETATTAGVADMRVNSAQIGIGGTDAGAAGAAGQYHQVKIWNAASFDGTPVLNWQANDMGQTGGASNGRTYTITRPTSGRKAVLVTRPVWLFGTDDYMEIADNALLDFSATDSFTLLAVVRQWATPTSYGRYIRKGSGAASVAGYQLSSDGTALRAAAWVGDGTSNAYAPSAAVFTAGSLQVVSAVSNRSTGFLTLRHNNTAGTPSSIAALGSHVNSTPFVIGRDPAGASNPDMELFAVAVFRHALTSADIAKIVAYYP